MSTDDLRKKLAATTAFASLAAERETIRIAETLGWQCLHGSIYRDPETKKTRELDVLARMRWKTTASKERRLDIYIPIEVKTAKDYHILFASPPPKLTVVNSIREWSGDENSGRKRVLRALNKIGFSAQQLSAVQKSWSSLTYPRGSALGLRTDPPDLAWTATAFRETRPNAEARDLETSVLWKAMLGLRSAIEALRRGLRTFDLEWIRSQAQTALDTGEDAVVEALSYVHFMSLHAIQIHPVVVIESPLWIASGKIDSGSLTQIPWCRFVETNHFGHADRWCDIVHRQSFKGFLGHLSASYGKALRRRRLRLEAG